MGCYMIMHFLAGIKIVPMTPPCPNLGSIKQGSVRVDYNISINLFVVHYTCEDGYVLSGDELRFCQENRQWSGIEPICFQSKYTLYNHK